MNALKKIGAWLSGPGSDFALLVVLLVLVNLVGARAFLRLDLTPQHSYSLSPASREVLRTVEEPLSIKVFFSKNLPAPYNEVERYLRDLLVEYRGAGNRNFSYEFFDMDKPDSEELARSYGLGQVQIQEVKDNEVGLKNAWMSLVILYSDGIEVMDNLSSTEGLEYRLTTTVGRMVSTANSLSGLQGKVRMTLYASSDLGQFGIKGFGDLEKTVRSSFDRVNRKSQDRIEFSFVDPLPSVVDGLSSRYGLQKINWTGKNGGADSGSGLVGIVLEYQDRISTIPVELARSLFGGYSLAGLDNLDKVLSDSLQALLSRSAEIGYVTGHGEKDLSDERNGAAGLKNLVSDRYTLTPVPTATEAIPANVTSLVINGPRSAFTESELYHIDQFLMRGGNLFLLLDPFEEIQGDSSYYGSQPVYRPISTGLERLLAAYGVTVGSNYVLDKTCYVVKQQGTGEVPLYYVPLIGKEGMNRKNPVSRNLAYVLFLQSASVGEAGGSGSGKTPGVNAATAHKFVPLATSSPESWLMSGNISLMPYGMQVPPKEQLAGHTLAALLEGSFVSAFDRAPDDQCPATAGTDGTDIRAEGHLASSVQKGRIIVTGTSAITGPQVLGGQGQEPVGIFIRNAVDYLNGNEGLIEMRTKGLSLNTLDRTTPAVRTAARVVNMYLLPLMVALAGLAVWRIRVARRRRIREKYALAGQKGTEV